SQNDARSREIKNERADIGEGEHKWAGRNFRIQLEPMQKRRDPKTKQRGSHQGKRDASANGAGAGKVAFPEPNYCCNDAPAAQAKQKGGGKFAPKRRGKPAPCHWRRAQHLNRHAHRLCTNTFVEAEHHGQKKCHHQTARKGGFKRAGEDRADCSRGHRDQQPRETEPKKPPRRCTADLFEMKSQDLEDIVPNGRGRTLSIFAFAHLKNFFGKKARVDNADDVAVLVNHWEGKEFVEHEKFAGIKHGCARGNGNDATHHDLVQRRVERRGQQTPCRQDSDQTFVGVYSKEINYTFANAFPPDAIKRFGHDHVRIQERKIFARVLDNPRVEIGNASGFRHSQLLRDERCLCSLEFVRLRKSTRLNSSHVSISYAVFCLKKKNKTRSILFVFAFPSPVWSEFSSPCVSALSVRCSLLGWSAPCCVRRRALLYSARSPRAGR